MLTIYKMIMALFLATSLVMKLVLSMLQLNALVLIRVVKLNLRDLSLTLVGVCHC